MTPNFDRIARLYRWLEYLTMGPVLAWTRKYHLEAGALAGVGHVLILGDGDGRFTAELLRRDREVTVEAVDSSAAMLDLLTRRCAPDAERLRVRLADARVYEPMRVPGLVVTHFFLDCLTQEEVEGLVERHGQSPVWLVSEFRVPEGLLRVPARVLIRGLYWVFWVLTGLRVREIPSYAGALRGAGFQLVGERLFLFGVLTTEVWRRDGP